MTCIQVSDNIVIDAGNILESLGEKAFEINHILLHTHLDYIVDIPFSIDMSFDIRQQPLIIYGLEQNIIYLKNHFFNGYILPDFSCKNRLPGHR
jgi:cAMP phosphodiesterase